MSIKKIGLDAGHSLKTAGKQTPDGIKEWYINDRVCDKASALLSAYDCEVVRTDNNEGNTDESLTYRRNKYLSEDVEAFASVHHNAFKSTWSGATGVEVYVDINATDEDLRFAEIVYKKLVAYTGLKGRGIKRANFTVIFQNKIPAILIEGGFMDGTTDYKVITSEDGQNAYARAVAEGFIEFLGLKKKIMPSVTPTTSAPIKKDLTAIAKEVIAGKWGNGAERKKKLKAAGYDYDIVQKEVNKLLGKSTTPAKKTNEQIAKEVIKGLWGNGQARKTKLKKAGYNPTTIQKIVNEMLKG